ncbi:chorion peroxidase-like [Portunus trituberculatus]|uniref:chorion peroxidase-like n=1 Tax=Portunus trituberculatus TaxID=210409 RepID=UPI001E1D1E78|nr:chorion peroxidase-like [Portunus trituberculatus]
MAEVTLVSLFSILNHYVPIENPSPESLQCQGPLPLYLREPFSVTTRHDHNQKATSDFISAKFPLVDDIESLGTWRDTFSESRRASQTGNGSPPQPPPHPRNQSAPRLSWKYIPNDLSSSINDKNLEIAFQAGHSEFNKVVTLEQVLKRQNLSLSRTSPPSVHQRLFRRSHPLAKIYSVLGYIMDYCTIVISQILQSESSVDVTPLELQLLGTVDACETRRERDEEGPCHPDRRYRTINGTCNNIANPSWGSAFSPLRRIVQADYGDGVMSLRRAQDGKPLPSARLVSATINRNRKSAATCFSFLHLTFGQFVDHDITSTPVAKGEDEETIPCCIDEVNKDPNLFHPECAPITIPADDPFYSTWGATCMEFIRSLPAERCLIGPREQVNQITSFLDASNVYGSTDEDSENLREGEGGRLLVQVAKNGESLLPPSTDREDGCNDEEKFRQDEFCFIAGDDRVNEQVMLTLMHTVWVREHNRVARQLEAQNPSWPDDLLFQEARRIVVAEMQHIVYNEFLPGVLGRDLMERLDLLPQKDGRKTNNYNPNISPTISNEFSTAAFRFGHSMITDNILEINKDGKKAAQEVSEVLFQPFFLYAANSTKRLLKGSVSQNVLKVDPLFTEEVTGKLFRGDKQFGMDLVALNLQRGRDHGIGSYLRLREACGLAPVRTFSDLIPHLLPGAEEQLRKVYRTVEDIDLFAGGVSEKPIEGGQVGPTFACIISDQFLRLKIGDRYWYEEEGPGAFTRDQLRELHRVSLARIMCDNVLGTHTIARWPLQVSSAFNPQISCQSDCIPSINFDFWQADEYRKS